MLWIVIYLLYAFIQATLLVRYYEERTAPGLMVFLLSIIAPAITFLLIMQGFSNLIMFLITYKKE